MPAGYLNFVSHVTLKTILRAAVIVFSNYTGVHEALAAEGRALIFEQANVDITLPIDQSDAEAAFIFKNSANVEVRILEIETDCECVKTAFTPPIVASGQSGQVTLRFRTKLRNGTETVRVKVVADNGEIHEISVSAKLRSYIEVRPQALRWMKGEKRDAKEFTISSTGLGKLNFIKVTAVKATKAEIYRGKDPSSIRIQVTPPTSDGPFQDVLLVSAEIEGTNETRLYDLHLKAD